MVQYSKSLVLEATKLTLLGLMHLAWASSNSSFGLLFDVIKNSSKLLLCSIISNKYTRVSGLFSCPNINWTSFYFIVASNFFLTNSEEGTTCDAHQSQLYTMIHKVTQLDTSIVILEIYRQKSAKFLNISYERTYTLPTASNNYVHDLAKPAKLP
jgi:hypothetical protein